MPGLFPNGIVALSTLFANEQAAGPTVRYYRMDSATAAIVAEARVQPDAGLAITAVDIALKKIATVSTLTYELSDDAPAMVDAVASELQSPSRSRRTPTSSRA